MPDGRKNVDHSSLIKVTPAIRFFVNREYPRIKSWRKLAQRVEKRFNVKVSFVSLQNHYYKSRKNPPILDDPDYKCKYCGSQNLVKRGHRYQKSGTIKQIYKCCDCNRKSTSTPNPREKSNQEKIQWVVENYPIVKSWRKMEPAYQKRFNEFVCYQTLLRWYKAAISQK